MSVIWSWTRYIYITSSATEALLQPKAIYRQLECPPFSIYASMHSSKNYSMTLRRIALQTAHASNLESVFVVVLTIDLS